MRALIGTLVAVWLVLQSLPTVAEESIRIDRVEITGNQRVEEEAIRVRLHVVAGSLFDEEDINVDVRSLYEMGFFDNIEAHLSEEEADRVLTYHVVERPFVERVKIEGNKKIDREELEKVLRVRPNTIFDPEKARRGVEEAKKLYGTKGYLEASVEYQTEPVPDHKVAVTFVVDEAKPVRIYELNFEGNRTFSDRQLSAQMTTKKKWFLSFVTGRGNLDRDVLKTDLERLTAYYYEHGHIDVRIDDPIVERDESGLKVTIKIDEGEIYEFGKVELGGDLLPEVEKTRGLLGAKEGQTFRASKLREDINLLTEFYGDRGYAFVNVTPETGVDPSSRRVDVLYQISRGPEVYIDRIEITGNTKTRDKVIRRELELQEQQRFAGARLRRSQERLRRLGFFQEVNITTRKAEQEDRLDLLVDVKEGSTGSFAAGAGVSSGESFLFNLRLSEINLFGRGHQLVANADFGSIRRNLSLSFTEPYFRDTELTVRADVFNWKMEFDEFTRAGTGGAVRFLYPVTALGWRELWGISLLDTRLGLEYRLENASIEDVSASAASAIRAEQGEFLTSSLIPQIVRDTRNHPFDPTAGSLQELSFEFAGVGGDSEFIKLDSRTRWYYPVWTSKSLGTFTVSTGWTFGYGWGYGDNRELPLFERYFPGGINSVRGYDVRSLGPRVAVFTQAPEPGTCAGDLTGCQSRLVRRDVLGGSQQLVFNNEFIFPIVEALKLKGVIFFDAGQAYSASEGIRFEDMRTSVGFGVRWLSPMGPLRIEIGFPINPRVGDDTQAILFSFGGPP